MPPRRRSFPRRRAPARRRTYKRATSSRRSPRAVRPKKSACVCPNELTPSAKFALAQLDPFEPLAQGAKVPDSTTIPSIANCDTDQVALTTAATQTLAAIAFWPSYTNAVLPATWTAGVLTWNTTLVQDRRNQAAVVTNIEGIRAVAHAIRLSCSLSATSATGFVHIGIGTESRLSTSSTLWQLPTTVNEMTGLAHYKRFTLSSLTQSPITAINKWLDETAFRYDIPEAANTPTTASSTFANFTFGSTWGQLVVMVENVPASSTIISAEHILLSEMIPKKTGFLIGSQAAPNSPGTMSAVSSMTAETDFAHTEAGQEGHIQQGLSALQRGAAAAGEQIYQTVAVPLAQRVGGMAVNAAFNYGMAAVMGVGGLPGQNSNPNRLSITRT